MKKSIALLALIVLTTNLSAQVLPEGFSTTYGGKIEMKSIIKKEGDKQNYNTVLKWASQVFENKNTLNSEGLIIVQAVEDLKESPRPAIGNDDNKLLYNLEIWFYNDRIEIVLSNIRNQSFTAGIKPVTPIENWFKERKNGKFPIRFVNTLDNVEGLMNGVLKELSTMLN